MHKSRQLIELIDSLYYFITGALLLPKRPEKIEAACTILFIGYTALKSTSAVAVVAAHDFLFLKKCMK